MERNTEKYMIAKLKEELDEVLISLDEVRGKIEKMCKEPDETHEKSNRTQEELYI